MVFNKNLAFIDKTSNQAVHFDGQNWRILNPEECHPGFEFNPLEIRFDKKNGELFVSNSWGIWGFKFNTDGSCIGAAHKSFRAPYTFTFDQDLYGLSSNNKFTYLRSWNNEGVFQDTLFIENNELPQTEYRISTGGIVKSKDALYFLKGSEPNLYKINLSDEAFIKEELKSKSLFYSDSDLPANYRTPEFMKKAGEYMRTYSINFGLYDFSDKNLLLVTRKFGEETYDYYCYLISKAQLKIESEFIIEDRVVYAGKEKIYSSKPLNTEYPANLIQIYELQ